MSLACELESAKAANKAREATLRCAACNNIFADPTGVVGRPRREGAARDGTPDFGARVVWVIEAEAGVAVADEADEDAIIVGPVLECVAAKPEAANGT